MQIKKMPNKVYQRKKLELIKKSKLKLHKELGKAVFYFLAIVMFNTLLILSFLFGREYFKHYEWSLQSPIILRSPIKVTKKSEAKEAEQVTESDQPKGVVEMVKAKEVEKREPEWLGTAKVTAYSCGGEMTAREKAINCPNGITATGTIPQPKKTVACDRANLGRTFEIEGLGQVVCEDTGGSIKGAGRFDIYLETIQEAKLFGVQYLLYREVL